MVCGHSRDHDISSVMSRFPCVTLSKTNFPCCRFSQWALYESERQFDINTKIHICLSNCKKKSFSLGLCNLFFLRFMRAHIKFCLGLLWCFCGQQANKSMVSVLTNRNYPEPANKLHTGQEKVGNTYVSLMPLFLLLLEVDCFISLSALSGPLLLEEKG